MSHGDFVTPLKGEASHLQLDETEDIPIKGPFRIVVCEKGNNVFAHVNVSVDGENKLHIEFEEWARDR